MGTGSKVRDQNGHNQFGRIQISDLPFAHQADGGNHGDIQQQCAQHRNGHCFLHLVLVHISAEECI